MEFEVGVNYWPVRKGTGLWKSFDSGEVREDFARLGEWNLSPARIFLIWEDFQPEPQRVNLKVLDRLVELAQYAEDRGLKLWVTFFTGHVHGANWLPAWMVRSDMGEGPFPLIVSSVSSPLSPGNPYVETDIQEAQRLLIREVMAALHGHQALWGWDLGNMPSNLFRPLDREQGRRWLQEMAGEIRSKDQEHPVTLGLHQADLEEDRGMAPADVAEVCDVISMQAYPSLASWSAGPADSYFSPFVAALTRWLGEGKEVWISALGISTRGEDEESRFSVDEDTAAKYAVESLEALRRYGFPGALWWCYGDYTPALWGRPPYKDRPQERASGIIRHDWRPKLLVEALCGVGKSRGKEVLPSDWIDLEPEDYWKNPGSEIRRLYRRFRESVSLFR